MQRDANVQSSQQAQNLSEELKQKQAEVLAYLVKHKPTNIEEERSLYSLFQDGNKRSLLYSFLSLQEAGRVQSVYECSLNHNRGHGRGLLQIAAAREFPRLVQAANWQRLSKIIPVHPELMFKAMVFNILGAKMKMTPLEYCCFVRDKYIREMCNRATLTDEQRAQFHLTIQKFKPAAKIPTHEETIAEDGYKVFMENYVNPWLEEYELDAIPDGSEKREKRVIYLGYTEPGLKYEVLGLMEDDNNVKHTGLIKWQDLPEDFPRNLQDILRSNGECLTAIMEHTYLAKHTQMAKGVTINSMREYLLGNTIQMSNLQNGELAPSYCLQPFYWVLEACDVMRERSINHDLLITDIKKIRFGGKIDGFAKRHLLPVHMRKQMQALGPVKNDNWYGFDEANFPVKFLVRDFKSSKFIDVDCDDNIAYIFGENYTIVKVICNYAVAREMGGRFFFQLSPVDLMAFRKLDETRRLQLITCCELLDKGVENEKRANFGK